MTRAGWLALLLLASAASAAAPPSAELRWGGDAEGGYPIVQADPADPSRVRGFDDDVHPYEDLAGGRLDAVLLDHILAARSVARVPGLVIQPRAFATGRYVGVLAKGNEALRDRIDDALRGSMRSGALEAIFRKWGVWDDGQRALFARTLERSASAAATTTPP